MFEDHLQVRPRVCHPRPRWFPFAPARDPPIVLRLLTPARPGRSFPLALGHMPSRKRDIYAYVAECGHAAPPVWFPVRLGSSMTFPAAHHFSTSDGVSGHSGRRRHLGPTTRARGPSTVLQRILR